MFYICTNAFANPTGKPIKIENVSDEAAKLAGLTKGFSQTYLTVGGKPAETHIHKGAVFAIGSATDEKDLSPADKTLVAQLMVAKKIERATPGAVARISAEVATEQATADRDKKRDALSDPVKVLAELVAGLPDAIASAVAEALKAKK
jgi:hypothetical protein